MRLIKATSDEKTPKKLIIDPEKPTSTTEKVVNKDVKVGQ